MAFKNPFSSNSSMGFVFNTVMSSIPQTESYKWTVRKEKPQKYVSMVVVAHADYMKVYNDEKGKVFECVVQAPGGSDAFSLFRLTNEDDALARFILLHQHIQPFFNGPMGLYDVTVLQKLSDITRKKENISHAHAAVLAGLNDAFRCPEVIKHVNSKNGPTGKTPLHSAIECRSMQAVMQLLDCGASQEMVDDNGDGVFHYAARSPAFGSQVMSVLSKDKQLMDRTNKAGQSALLVACQEGNFDTAVKLVRSGATVDMNDNVGYPIHYALKKCNVNTALIILEKHRNQGRAKCIKHGGTPLHWAKSTEFVKLVLEQEYDIDAISKSGDTALSIMIQRSRPLCALTLMTAGADPNIADKNGNTPLHHAVKIKDLQTVHLLIGFGAEVNKLNNRGESPRHLAATDILNTIGGMMGMKQRMEKGFLLVAPWTQNPEQLVDRYSGMNSEVIYALHAVGAERCPPGTKGCQGGCKHGGQNNGMAPKIGMDQVDAGAQVYNKYLTQCIADMSIAARTGRQGRDESDLAMDTTDGASDPSQRRSEDTVLCLDGGGIKGLILTQMLAAIEKSSGKKIVEMFDWIVGTSTGGILALALSQGFSVEECRKLYMALKDEVFTGSRPYNSDKFESFLQSTFGPETTMDQHTYPRILVSGTLGDRSPPALHLFRNYDAPETSSAWIAANQEPFEPVLKPSEQLVWKAARSSGAAPTYFRPMGRFLDGGLIANNPSLDALTEIQEYYMYKKAQGEPVRKIGAVVSLGTGLMPLKPIAHVEIMRPNSAVDLLSAAKSLAGGANLIDIMVEQVCESRMRAVDRARAWCFSIGTPFFRLSPPLSQDITMDETRDHVLLKMLFDTQCYIQKNKENIQQMTDVINSL
ncbi:85/88 kDa calcium-independent phospholipase A2-like isoform X1 [Lytechinus variegatus]|uniref:85/88 kDa calcium-independent phospholipase A2-like isoform X1 n=1 Tax=Lytechinus variegatus TaxID=7654 RepID=UPI001BB19697|nr:85/88 kDa calcium-independent phospholipase A2-like isoform X1 [Lytechinus variegatus]